MSFELIKETLKFEELKETRETQVLVETELYLSPSNPEIEKLLFSYGKAEILNTKIIRDKLIVSGVTTFKVVYNSQEEETIHTLETVKEFKEEIEMEGITEDMWGDAQSKIEYIEADLDEAKINLRALVNLRSIIGEINTVDIIKDITGKEELQILKETINYREVRGRETTYVLLKEGFQLGDSIPPIEEVLKLSIELSQEELTVVEDRMILAGEARTYVIYYGEGEIHSVSQLIPFNHFIEIPGAEQSLKGKAKLELVEGLYEVLENEEGEMKILDFEIKIRVSGQVYDELEKELILDLYSTKEEILLEKEEITLKENIKEIYYVENIAKEIENSNIMEIYGIDKDLVVLDVRYLEEKILIEGILNLDIYYLDRITNEISVLKEEMPYKSYIDEEEFTLDTVIDVEASLGRFNYILRRDILSMDSEIKHDIKLNKIRKISGVKEITKTGELINKKNKPSIIVYIVQKSDILWDIAKRYNTTLEEIMSSNDIPNAEDIKVGDKIIIEKKVDLSF